MKQIHKSCNSKVEAIAKNIEKALNNRSNLIAFKIIHENRKTKNKASFSSIAGYLNHQERTTSKGNKFSKGSVKQIYDRFLRYTDPESGEFKEGEIELKTNDISAKVFLEIKSGKVFIRTNYNPLKPFSFYKRKSDSFATDALNAINNAYSQAKSSITISNFSVYFSKIDDYERNYFKQLENLLAANKEIEYQRIIQIPFQLYKAINASAEVKEKGNLDEIILYAAYNLIPEYLREHIARMYRQNNFNLIIYKFQRTTGTYASVDDSILIEEDYGYTSDGVVEPLNLKIYNNYSSEPGSHIESYISEKKVLVAEWLHEIQISEEKFNNSREIQPLHETKKIINTYKSRNSRKPIVA